jgi:peptidoglycan/xylan/chitin deacetylase (PgdA/CDA1 family)
MTIWKPSRRMLIKRFLRRSVSIVSCYSGIAWLWYYIIARRGVRILTYHAVESPPRNAYAVSIENFQLQMSYLKEKCHVISLAEFQRYVREKRTLPPNTLLLTFDDGFKSFYEVAYPILKRLQLPSICFLILEKMQGDDEDFLHWAEANELLKDSLIAFGSHAVSHRSLAHMNDEDLRYEVTVEIFSYPYGTRSDFDRRSVSALSAAGYRWACTSLNGINRNQVNPLKLFRTKVEWGDDLRTFRRILKGCLDVWFLIDLCLPFLQNRGEVDFQ